MDTTYQTTRKEIEQHKDLAWQLQVALTTAREIGDEDNANQIEKLHKHYETRAEQLTHFPLAVC